MSADVRSWVGSFFFLISQKNGPPIPRNRINWCGLKGLAVKYKQSGL